MQQAGSIGLHLLECPVGAARALGRSVLTGWANAPIGETGRSNREPSTHLRHRRFAAIWPEGYRQLLREAGRCTVPTGHPPYCAGPVTPELRQAASTSRAFLPNLAAIGALVN